MALWRCSLTCFAFLRACRWNPSVTRMRISFLGSSFKEPMRACGHLYGCRFTGDCPLEPLGRGLVQSLFMYLESCAPCLCLPHGLNDARTALLAALGA